MNNFEIKEPFVVDVSSWEDEQDWSKISPRPFVAIARATYSNYLTDRTLAHNWAEWREHGIRKTAYGFPIPAFGADDQAKLFVKAMKGVGGWDAGDLPPVLDFEQAGFTAHQIKVWLDRVEGEFGVKPIIYTRADIWDTICTNNAPEWTSDYPLWVGWYPFTEYIDKNDTVPENRMPKGWDKWALWQYSEAGRLDFDPHNGYDFNVMSEWYQAEILETPIAPPTDPPIIDPPTEPSLETTGKVTSWTGVNIRKGAGIEHDKFAAIWYGKDVEFSEMKKDDSGNTWGKLENAWCAIDYNGRPLIELDEQVEPPPAEPPTPTTGRENWKSDPDRPDKLYISRHTGYYKVKVWRDIGGVLEIEAPQSAIFVGDSLLGGRWLRLVEMNLKPQSGWIDITEKDMICDQVPEVTLNSPIPPAKGKVEIKRTVTIPPTGDFVYLEHRKTKDYKFAVPATQMLWADNNQRPAWMRTRPDYHWLYFDLMMLRNPGLSIIRYVSMYAYYHADNRYRTDSRKDGEFFDDLHDAVLGKNLGKPCWLMKIAIRNQGNVMKVLAKNGSEVLLDGLDMTKPAPMAEDIIDKEWLVGYATQQEPEILPDGKPKTTHFPVARNSDGDETGTIELQIKTPYWINMGKVGLVWAENNRVCKVVNLKRDY